ncbi:hypothetical protein HMPREF1503_0214 [Olsenella uli MSTE5]|nr:hypothetical protein HMPREF1503_0214 [Olsenella uli MSTE5]
MVANTLELAQVVAGNEHRKAAFRDLFEHQAPHAPSGEGVDTVIGSSSSRTSARMESASQMAACARMPRLSLRSGFVWSTSKRFSSSK